MEDECTKGLLKIFQFFSGMLEKRFKIGSGRLNDELVTTWCAWSVEGRQRKADNTGSQMNGSDDPLIQ